MKNLKTFLLFISLFALIFVFLNVQITPARKRVLSCDPSKIRKIVLSTDEEVTLLETYGDLKTWKLRSGDTVLGADRDVVKKFQNLLCHLGYVESFKDVSPEQSKDYGFSSPRRQIEITTDATVTLLIGDDTPSTTEFYVSTRENPDQVFLVANAFLPSLTAHLPDLMERHVFDRLKEDGAVSIGRDDANMSPMVSDAKTIDLLRAQSFTNYQGPLAEEKTLDYGMGLPDFHIDWKRSDGSSARYDFSFFSEKYYLRVQIGAFHYVLILEPSAAQALWAKVNELQN